ncbi:MAG: ArsR family transcriptional regulator [Ilumatobacteraceae bacterium]
MGDPARLAIVDELALSDRASSELQTMTGLPSNLLAHHLDVLERVGLISRHRSSGDGRRRYVHLEHAALTDLAPVTTMPAGEALFVCTRNSARSPLAAALWEQIVGQPARSAGTHPADRVHPGAVASGKRAGLDLTDIGPRSLADTAPAPSLVITVCDQAHEELEPGPGWLHWSIADPIMIGTARAFDAARDDLRHRIESLFGGGAVA